MKKVAVLVNSRANYARIKSVLRKISQSESLELQLILGASSVLNRFGDLETVIQNDGLKPVATINSIVEGDRPSTMATSTGLSIIELTALFESLQPDLVFTVADRFETLGTAIAASYSNIPVAHTQGGELTGSIDESVRHAVTKLSHYHFPATKKAAALLLRMGEAPESITVSGCPSIDLISDISDWGLDDLNQALPGVGADVDLRGEYLVVLQHPVTTDWINAANQIVPTIHALEIIDKPTVWLWPNVDAGSDVFSRELRRARESGKLQKVRFVKNLPPENYLRLINGSRCVVGNSSSAIREGAFLGIRAVNIGDRQANRERADNVIEAEYATDSIVSGIEAAMNYGGKAERSEIFGSGTAAELIVKRIEGDTPHYQKAFYY